MSRRTLTRWLPPDCWAGSPLASAGRSGTQLDKIYNTVHRNGRISNGLTCRTSPAAATAWVPRESRDRTIADGRRNQLFAQVRALTTVVSRRSPEPCAQVRILLGAQLDTMFSN
jgi:hypothetical protein